MSFRLGVAVALISQVLGVVSHAQGHRDFSGRWTLVPERSVIQGREGPITVAVFGTDFTVQRESNTLLIRVAPDLAPTYQVNLAHQHCRRSRGRTTGLSEPPSPPHGRAKAWSCNSPRKPYGTANQPAAEVAAALP